MSVKEGWKTIELDEVASVIDSLHKTPKYSDNGYPMVRVTDIKGGSLLLNSTLTVSKEVFSEFSAKHMPRKGDIVFSRVGSYGISSRVVDDTPFCLGQNTVFIIPKINSDFLYYSLNSPNVKSFIEASATGSTQRTISLRSIRSIPIFLPSRNTQYKIASILSSLDEKIDLNRQMNQTLEAMAQTLFQEMCMPKGDKLPEGWEWKKLGELSSNRKQVVNPSELLTGTNYIGLEHMPRQKISLEDWGVSEDVSSNKYEFKKNDILFGKLRPYFHKVGIAPINGVCSTDILVITPAKDYYLGFLLMHYSSNELVAYANSTSGGTRMPRTSWKDLKEYEVAFPHLRYSYTSIITSTALRKRLFRIY